MSSHLAKLKTSSSLYPLALSCTTIQIIQVQQPQKNQPLKCPCCICWKPQLLTCLAVCRTKRCPRAPRTGVGPLPHVRGSTWSCVTRCSVSQRGWPPSSVAAFVGISYAHFATSCICFPSALFSRSKPCHDNLAVNPCSVLLTFH